MSYRVDITTGRNPFPTPCTPRFETFDEAHAYAQYLITTHSFITGVEVHEGDGESNATYDGALAWMDDEI